jgi:hypothetical protein
LDEAKTQQGGICSEGPEGRERQTPPLGSQSPLGLTGDCSTRLFNCPWIRQRLPFTLA